MGMAGLAVPLFEGFFTPFIEVGRCLCKGYRGHGYATEAAKAWLHAGFHVLGAEKTVSFTATTNTPSENVTKRIGMTKIGGFDHSKAAPGSPLHRHVVYKITDPSEAGQ